MMITALLLLTSPALAYKHTGYIWDVDNGAFPIPWYMQDTEEPDLPGVDLVNDVLQRSWDQWETAPCAGVSDSYKGTANNTCADNQDGLTTFHWDDPCDEMSPGILAWTTYNISGNTKPQGGKTYRLFLDADITFNNDVSWGMVEDMEASCLAEQDVIGTAVHEIGHLYGLGHSCDQGEVCSDELLKTATMFWSGGTCDTSGATINQDDIDGITALYGVQVSFEATGDRYGGTPLKIGFEIEADDESVEVISAEWRFGDGGTSTELNPTHEFVAQDQYTVSVDYVFFNEECGEVESREVKLGYIIACEPPAVAEGAPGFFQMGHVDGLQYQAYNHSDVTTYGCIDEIAWNAYKGTSVADATEANLVLSANAWAPILEFPADGSYVVVMTVGGPGGVVASSMVVNTADVGSGGCNSAPGAAGLGLVGLLALRRRRR